MYRKINIFCFPYAGGSATIFLKWKKYTPQNIDIIPMELAGRYSRLKEASYRDFQEAVDDLYKKIVMQVDANGQSEYALFGHSMGCWLAYEVGRKLTSENKRLPLHLFLSGRWSPDIKKPNQLHNRLPLDELKMQLHKMGGTPRDVLEEETLWNMFYPILREDLRILDAYEHQKPDLLLRTDISVLTGASDSCITRDELEKWKNLTSASTTISKFKGDHFFIDTSTRSVVEYIVKCLHNYSE